MEPKKRNTKTEIVTSTPTHTQKKRHTTQKLSHQHPQTLQKRDNNTKIETIKLRDKDI